MNSSFKYIPAERQVEFIAEGLTGYALRFFYERISPRLGRYAPDLEVARVPQGTCADVCGRNVLRLYAALRLLETQFCTREDRNVLRLDLVSLSLFRVQQDVACDRAEELRLLKRRIERLSANGPIEYRSEVYKVDVFIGCMRGKRWALALIISCKDNTNNPTLQYYAESLLNLVRVSNKMKPESHVAPIMSSASLYEDQDWGPFHEVYYEDTRDSPRFRGSLRRPTPLRAVACGNTSSRPSAQSAYAQFQRPPTPGAPLPHVGCRISRGDGASLLARIGARMIYVLYSSDTRPTELVRIALR